MWSRASSDTMKEGVNKAVKAYQHPMFIPHQGAFLELGCEINLLSKCDSVVVALLIPLVVDQNFKLHR